MIDERNIYEKGMLISLSIGAYPGRMKLSKEQLKDLPTEIVRGVHDIFDNSYKELLQAIEKYDRETRWEVKRRSVPFPIDGVWFVSSSTIGEIIKLLDERREERKKLIDKAADEYENAIAIFADKYPDFHRHALQKRRYISKERFLSRFYFTYQFIKIAAPDKDNKFISPEMYRTEMKKFKDTIEEMKREVLGVIYSALLESATRLKKQCKDGKPNQRTLDTLNTFLSRVDEVYSDFIDRNDVKDAISKIKKQVLGVDAESLRSDESFKKKFGKAITTIVNEIQALPDMPLTRAIDF
jgi:hypothetical protein